MTAPSDIVEEFGDTATVNESRPAAVSYRKIRDHIGPNSVTPITDETTNTTFLKLLPDLTQTIIHWTIGFGLHKNQIDQIENHVCNGVRSK